MGGHGGLNILPQKRWNVYNYENREKVRRDEEAAAKEEQIQREQARKREAEFRLERLRHARGLAPSSAALSSIPEPEPESTPKTNHINLFEGIKIFDPVSGAEGKGDDERGAFKRMKMAKKEAAPRTVMPEDEKYRMGYGVAGKGVKLPWYLSRPSDDGNAARDLDEDDEGRAVVKEAAKSKGKKTLEELREERLKREKKEKERERALIMEKSRRDGTFSKDRRSFRR